jgi:hypothetical protein
LALRRAQALARALGSVIPHTSILIASLGRISTEHHTSAKFARAQLGRHPSTDQLQRPTPGHLTRLLESCGESDFFLIDASGSMSGSWNELRNFEFPRNARVFLSKVMNCRDGTPLRAVRAEGGTEILHSYWVLLDQMQPRQNVCVISDWEHHYNTRTTMPHLERKIIEKRVGTIQPVYGTRF